MFNSKTDIPLYIGSEKIFTEKRKDILPPHDHKNIVGTYSQADEGHVKSAIDNLLKRNKKRVRLIKIDVDGYELEVLKSAEKTLEKNKPIIYFELAPYLYKEMGYTVDHLIRYIKKIDYAFYDEDFKPVLDIKLDSSKLTDKSQNYFLFHNSFLVI